MVLNSNGHIAHSDGNYTAQREPTPEGFAKHRVLLDQAACLRDFIASYRELDSYRCVTRSHIRLRQILILVAFFVRNGASISLTGDKLSIPAVVAVARYPELVSGAIDEALVRLSKDDARVEALNSSRKIIDDKLAQNKSIYGVSTGFGGSGTSTLY